MGNPLGRKPDWLISDNTSAYISKIVIGMFRDMDVQRVQIVPKKSEENEIDECFNGIIMNDVRTALHTTGMSWEYWTWALADATDKYNQLPQNGTCKSPHQAWYGVSAPDLTNL